MAPQSSKKKIIIRGHRSWRWRFRRCQLDLNFLPLIVTLLCNWNFVFYAHRQTYKKVGHNSFLWPIILFCPPFFSLAIEFRSLWCKRYLAISFLPRRCFRLVWCSKIRWLAPYKLRVLFEQIGRQTDQSIMSSIVHYKFKLFI